MASQKDFTPVFFYVEPFSIAKGATLPMIPDSFRYGFFHNNGTLCFGSQDSGPLVAWDAVKDLIATPAPQAAPSDLHAAIMNLPCHGFDHAYKEGHRDARHAAAELVAAAPAVAITQAATSEPVAAQFKMPGETWEECGIDEEEVMLKHGYKFRYLYAAPVAHLAGTTPNTEAPSDERERFELWATVNNLDATEHPHHAYEDSQTRAAWAAWQAALSAQQAGAQEAPSEDALRDPVVREALQEHRAAAGSVLGRCTSGEERRHLISVIARLDAALAAATQTEKK